MKLATLRGYRVLSREPHEEGAGQEARHDVEAQEARDYGEGAARRATTTACAAKMKKYAMTWARRRSWTAVLVGIGDSRGVLVGPGDGLAGDEDDVAVRDA